MDERQERHARRILDANLNRAAEALRVVEDVCRFHWNLVGPARELKWLRHQVLGVVTPSAAERMRLVEARDIEGDMGRANPSPPAGGQDLEDVAFRNIERAKEAFRTLEETTRAVSPSAAPALESLRYRLYAIEKGLAGLRSSAAHPLLARARLCLLATSATAGRSLEETVSLAIRGGVDAVQLREKHLSDALLLQKALSLRELTARAGVLFIVNDRVDVALLSGADGVHLGQDDLPVATARDLSGSRLLIGVSTHGPEDARRAERDGADYIGVGPMFPSTTKDAGPPLGPEGLALVLAVTSLPAFAIGGINPERVAVLRTAGATRIAVSSAVLAAGDPTAAARALRLALEAEAEAET
jgi:thiamine-phosphate pyrophosphorylase